MTRFKSCAAIFAVAASLALVQTASAEDDLGVTAIKNHDWATAERVLQEGLQQDPNNMSRRLNLAWVYAQTGRKEEAATLYRDILKRDEDRFASKPGANPTSMTTLARRGLALLNTR